MIIYNKKNKHLINQLILNTECCYYKNLFEKKELHSFFLDLTIPKNSQTLLGMYVNFEIPFLPLYGNHHIYQRCMSHIIKKIKQHFDFDNTHLICLDLNNCFLVMFNVTDTDIISHTQNFIKDIEKRGLEMNHRSYHFQIHCGLYYTDTTITAYEFFSFTEEQLNHAIEHHTSFSFYSL